MSLNKKPFIIGIAGGSGSGKTFFLNCFLHHFKQDEVTLVSQDDYYIPAGEMTQERISCIISIFLQPLIANSF